MPCVLLYHQVASTFKLSFFLFLIRLRVCAYNSSVIDLGNVFWKVKQLLKKPRLSVCPTHPPTD